MAFLMASSAADGVCAKVAEDHPTTTTDRASVARQQAWRRRAKHLGLKGESNMDGLTQYKAGYFIGRMP
jgi:hypothetical protein